MNGERFNELFDTYHPVQNRNEFWWLITEVEKIQPKRILELGVENGGTFKFWEEMIPTNGYLMGIDFKDRVLWAYRSSQKPIKFIEADTLSVDLNVTTPFDFMFIDASGDGIREHQAHICKMEFDKYSKVVRPGGLIGFHDTGDVKAFLDTLDQSRIAYYTDTIGTALYQL